MKMSQMKEAIKSAILAGGFPVFVWGPPGAGKSEGIGQVVAELQRVLNELRAALLDPVDLRGCPKAGDDNLTYWCPPAFLPQNGDPTVLFFDELPQAPTMVMNAISSLIIAPHTLGEYTLPDSTFVIAAGNRETDRAATNRMPTHIANRFIHITLDVDLDEWVAWALQNGVATEVIAFLRFCPDLLHKFDPKSNDKAYPTPRSWTALSQVFQTRPSPEIELELYSGIVGEGAATQFLAFVRIFRSLPNVDDCITDPDNAPVPTELSAVCAITTALAKKASEQNMDRLVRYFNRLPIEYGVKAMMDCKANCPEIVNTRAYIQWMTDHQDIYV